MFEVVSPEDNYAMYWPDRFKLFLESVAGALLSSSSISSTYPYKPTDLYYR